VVGKLGCDMGALGGLNRSHSGSWFDRWRIRKNKTGHSLGEAPHRSTGRFQALKGVHRRCVLSKERSSKGDSPHRNYVFLALAALHVRIDVIVSIDEGSPERGAAVEI